MTRYQQETAALERKMATVQAMFEAAERAMIEAGVKVRNTAHVLSVDARNAGDKKLCFIFQRLSTAGARVAFLHAAE